MTNKKNKIKDTQERDYFFDINNPEQHNITWESAIETIKKFKPYYFCISHEIGLETNTPHFHIYFRCKSPVRFSTWSRRFPTAHKEQKIKGTPSQIRDYVLKINTWANHPKADTSIKTFEDGEIPIPIKEKHKIDKEKLLEDIKSGKTNMEIIEENPALAFRIREMDLLRSNYLAEKYGKEFREIKTYFFYGETATGKSTFVYNNWPSKDIFRIYNYDNLNAMWSGYNNERIIFMDEFDDTKVPLNMMLILCDKFPLSSGIMNRYQNITRCFDTIICACNRSYENIYTIDRVMRTSTWKALDRRFGNVWEFTKNANNEYNIIKHRETTYKEEKEDEEVSKKD